MKVFHFQRSGHLQDTYLLLWAKQGEVNLTLPMSSERLTLMRPFGTPLPLNKGAVVTTVRVSNRCYLRLAGMDTDATVRMLQQASINQVMTEPLR